MTAQFMERLRYNGEDVSMATTPLESLFCDARPRPDFKGLGTGVCTGCNRGYVGRWEIADGHLRLLSALPFGLDQELIPTLFPGSEAPIVATWYSGSLRIPRGKVKKSVHSGFASIFEGDTFIEIKEGRVVSTRYRENQVVAKIRVPLKRKGWRAWLLERLH